MPNPPLLVYTAANAALTIQIAETDVNPVIAGGEEFGWVSGSIANLAAGAIATVVFDLGPLWFRYPLAAVCFYPSSGANAGLSAVTVTGSDTQAYNPTRRLKETLSPGNTAIYIALASVGQSQSFVRPLGRYVVMQLTNADANLAQLATAKITLAAYPS